MTDKEILDYIDALAQDGSLSEGARLNLSSMITALVHNENQGATVDRIIERDTPTDDERLVKEPPETFADRLSARAEYELGRMAGRDELRAEQEERKKSGVWVEHAGHCNAEPQGEPSDAQVDAVAVAIAVAANADYWTDEIATWEDAESWYRETYQNEHPHMAYEDREEFRKQARAALRAANEVR